jgi:hypothetical protein
MGSMDIKPSLIGDGKHMSESSLASVDIKPSLIGDGKHMSESSPVSVEVTHEMRGGGRSCCPMVTKPRVKEARGCEEQLHQRNH